MKPAARSRSTSTRPPRNTSRSARLRACPPPLGNIEDQVKDEDENDLKAISSDLTDLDNDDDDERQARRPRSRASFRISSRRRRTSIGRFLFTKGIQAYRQELGERITRLLQDVYRGRLDVRILSKFTSFWAALGAAADTRPDLFKDVVSLLMAMKGGILQRRSRVDPL